MALKRGRPLKGTKAVEKVAKGADLTTGRSGNKEVRRLPPKRSEEEKAGLPEQNKAKSFTSITLMGSKGEKYEVAVPSSYVDKIPKKWEWTEERYRVAEMIAEGIPYSQIVEHPDIRLKSRMTIYGWMEHPEFKNHIDGLIMETGWANRRERLNKLQYLNDLILRKVAREFDGMKLTDKNIGALLNAVQAGAKMIAQEKGEFVEESKVTQDTNITGTVTNVTAKLEDFMTGKSEDERRELEKEFDKVGDDIIRAITGDKD